MTQVVPTSAQLWVHAHLCHNQGRTFLPQAHHCLEAYAGQAEGGQRPPEAAPARANTGARGMVGERGARAPRLLLGPWQHRSGVSLSDSGDSPLAQGAAAQEPTDTSQLGSNGPARHPVAPARQGPAPLPRTALCRQHPRWEPSAVVPHARICAGGRPQGRSLPPSGAGTSSEPLFPVDADGSVLAGRREIGALSLVTSALSCRGT